MEDRITVSCPLPITLPLSISSSLSPSILSLLSPSLLSLSPSPSYSLSTSSATLSPSVNVQWSLFAVFDGHGGSFSSSFLSDILPRLICEIVTQKLSNWIEKERDSKSILRERTRSGESVEGESMSGVKGRESEGETLLTDILHTVCVQADTVLRNEPRMRVGATKSKVRETVIERDSVTMEEREIVREREKRTLNCLDSSGSTAVIALVTPGYLAIANVGDSRAVLGKRCHSLSSSNVTDPFAVSHSHTHSPRASETRESTISSPSMSTNVSGKHHSILEAIALSTDHKARLPDEMARALKAGAT